MYYKYYKVLQPSILVFHCSFLAYSGILIMKNPAKILVYFYILYFNLYRIYKNSNHPRGKQGFLWQTMYVGFI